MHFQGTAEPQSELYAMRLMEAACGLGDPASCHDAAVFHFNGGAVPRDLQAAASLFQRACESGDQRACERVRIVAEAIADGGRVHGSVDVRKASRRALTLGLGGDQRPAKGTEAEVRERVEGEDARGWRVVARVTVRSVREDEVVVRIDDAVDRKRLRRGAAGLFLAWVP